MHPTDELNKLLVSKGTSPINQSVKFIELLKRPQLSYSELIRFESSAPEIRQDIIEKIEVNIKYEGYIKTQLAKIKEMKRLENKKLSENIDYSKISGLRIEAQEKLNEHKPLNIGQAGRISGVNPADITVLLIWLAANGEKEDNSDEQ